MGSVKTYVSVFSENNESGHSDMRIRGVNILLGAFMAVVLFAGIRLVWCVRPAPAIGDLSVVFLGLTNHPGGTVPLRRLWVVGNGRGLHALFAVTNITAHRYLNIDIDAVEIQGSQGWRATVPGTIPVNLGHGVCPGYGYHLAFPWPAGLRADTPWRLRLGLSREPKLLSLDLHHHGYGLKPYGRHTVNSEVVTPLRPVVAEPEASVGNAQSQDGAKDDERGRAHLETERQ